MFSDPAPTVLNLESRCAVSTLTPSLSQVTAGGGEPLAAQSKETEEAPSKTVVSEGRERKTGAERAGPEAEIGKIFLYFRIREKGGKIDAVRSSLPFFSILSSGGACDIIFKVGERRRKGRKGPLYFIFDAPPTHFLSLPRLDGEGGEKDERKKNLLSYVPTLGLLLLLVVRGKGFTTGINNYP